MTPSEKEAHVKNTPIHLLDEIYKIPVILDHEISDVIRTDYTNWLTEFVITCPSVMNGRTKISASYASTFYEWLETQVEKYDCPDIIEIEGNEEATPVLVESTDSEQRPIPD
jgi:hypothetical protein